MKMKYDGGSKPQTETPRPNITPGGRIPNSKPMPEPYDNPYFKRTQDEISDDPYYGGDEWSKMQPWERRDW